MPDEPKKIVSTPAEKPAEPGSEPDGIALGGGATVARDAIGFSYSSSSGPGGQNVNRRATKAQLRVAIGLIIMPPRARTRLRRQARALRTDKDELLITSDEFRSQRRNRQACLDRLRQLVARAMIEPKKRKKSKPTRGSVERRIESKKQRGQTKQRRRKIDP